MKIISTILLSVISVLLLGQSEKMMTYKEYISIVKENHPVMYKASLLDDMARSNRRMARGGFDPKVEANWNHKSFDDKNYYSMLNSAVKIPTWYGIDLKAGYDRSNGDFLNESDLIPTRGLWNAGISVPLGKGLVIDERRAALQRADIFESVNEQEQTIMINELLYEASIAYLDWQTAEMQLSIADEGVALATIRLDGTRLSFINGDKPAVDTLESYISLQDRQLDQQKAQQHIDNAVLNINNYLWIKGEVPLELEADARPEDMDIQMLSPETNATIIVQEEWILQHPELLMYDFKIADINIDQRLAREEIKPDLRVNYNPLLAVADDALFDQFNANDYKLGATFAYPILQRKQRGKIQMNDIKIQDTEYNRSVKTQDLNIKLDTYNNNINQTEAQYALLNETADNYERLLTAENRKFSLGESSIFLVNSRESKYLDTRYKLVSAGQKLLFNRLTYLLFSAKLPEVL